ncbi:hypothetical protein G6514_005047 [Epicoccum nigrum]|nr:hypothetical protein G6514_005047 [Epicoccum nigrum]
MYRRGDPRWNRTIQHISENLEHANETAAENLYGFTTRYVNPCLASLTHCCNAVTAPCFPSSDDRRRNRNRARSRGRAELSFDFYDDWEEDESDGLLGWGSDNLERFLGSASNYNYGTTTQPGRQRAMSYGTRARDPRFDAARRRSTVQTREGADPTLIPSSSYFGFLGRLPFRLGGKGLRYKPSAADLTEHPGALRRSVEEEQPLMEDSEEDHAGSDYKTRASQHRRARSNTHNSGHTTDSFSSRGDIFPSEDELDDAVPLDDEFTIALERRTTISAHGHGQPQTHLPDDHHSAHSASGRNTRSSNSNSSSSKRPSRSASARTASSGKKSVDEPPRVIEDPDAHAHAHASVQPPSLAELEQQEDQLRRDEDAELERKRASATQLAVQRGLVPAGSARQGADEHMRSAHRAVSPRVRSPASEEALRTPPEEVASFPDEGRGMQGEGESRGVLLGLRPGGEAARPAAAAVEEEEESHGEEFVPARLPRFG